jgi:NADH:ubiquinone oxidoreductase subunit 4 (subunit M)
MLENLIILPFSAFLIISFIPKNKINLIKKVSLSFSIIIFMYSILILDAMKFQISGYQYYLSINYIFNMQYIIGVDFISIFLIILMTLLIPICILTN